MPSPEPKPGNKGWLYRVLEPYYSRECVDNVMKAMLEGQISSGAAWPRKMVEEICNLYKARAVANMVKMVGAKPIYCDCAEGSVNPSVAELKEKATPRTKAVIVCHTYGAPFQDICEAMGTRADTGELVGTFGDFAVTSLYANKPITAGDGGWIHARDRKHHDRLKSLVNHGFDPQRKQSSYHFLHFEVAPNAKMNGLGAAFVCSQVKTLPEVMQFRGQVASWYRKELADVAVFRSLVMTVFFPETLRQIDAPWVFGVQTQDRESRDKLRDHLAAHGVETRRNYFYPLHLEPANFYGDEVGAYDIVLPNAEHLAQALVSSKAELLGNHQGLAEVVSKHLANNKPEVLPWCYGAISEVGARYADHVAAVIRWPNGSVRLAAVEAGYTQIGRVMFDFDNLDDVDDNAATPEWMKWRGVPQWQRAPEESECILEDREETFAAPEMPQDPKIGGAPGAGQEDFTFLAVEVPQLPSTAFDPLALVDETADAVEGNMSALNGQVIVNFATSAVEEFIIAKREREEYKAAYIDHLHQQRLQYLEKQKQDKMDKRGLKITKDPNRRERERDRVHAGKLVKVASDPKLQLRQDLAWLPLHLGGARGREPPERRKPRCAAVLALGAMRSEDGEGAEHAASVQELLDDGDWEVRSCTLEALAALQAALALGKFGDAAATYAYEAVDACAALAIASLSRCTGWLPFADRSIGQSQKCCCWDLEMKPNDFHKEGGTIAQKVSTDLQMRTDICHPLPWFKKEYAIGTARETLSGPYASAIALQLTDVDPETRSEACLALGHMGPYGLAFAEDWIFQEKIPSSLLCQTLLDASCREYFVDMKYMERAHDPGPLKDPMCPKKVDDFDPFVPLPRKPTPQRCSATDNLTFGMVSDKAWLETVEAMRGRVSVEEPAPPEDREDFGTLLVFDLTKSYSASVHWVLCEESHEEEEGEQAVNITERLGTMSQTITVHKPQVIMKVFCSLCHHRRRRRRRYCVSPALCFFVVVLPLLVAARLCLVAFVAVVLATSVLKPVSNQPLLYTSLDISFLFFTLDSVHHDATALDLHRDRNLQESKFGCLWLVFKAHFVPMQVQRDPHTGITSTSNEEVEIEDGATMEVVPRRLNLKAELVAADPQSFLAKLRGEPEEDEPLLQVGMLYETLEIIWDLIMALYHRCLGPNLAGTSHWLPSAPEMAHIVNGTCQKFGLKEEDCILKTQNSSSAVDAFHFVMSKATADLGGSINSTVDSLEQILPRQKGRLPRKVEDLVLWVAYLILVSYVLMQILWILSKWLCCCCWRRKEQVAAEAQKSSVKRPPFLPSSDSFLPPLRPRPHDEIRPRKRTPECCIFNFCS
eukprot:Skav200481  [mRNA]  locus=scaffold450:47462:101178:+ [translate_table: standard]